MRTKQFSDMLLFSKERSGWRRYLLYFVKSSDLSSAAPRLYRLTVAWKRQFDDFALGGIYSLETQDHKIRSYVRENRYALSGPEYFALLRQRDLIFLNDEEKARIGIDLASYDPADFYYSIGNIQKLLEYQPSPLHRAAYHLVQFFASVLTYILPILVYLLYVFFISSRASSSQAGIFGGILVPLVTLAAIPFLFFVMHVSGQLYEELMLRTESIKYDLLQQYALEWAGMRKNIGIQREEVHSITRMGIWTVGAALLGLLLALILL